MNFWVLAAFVVIVVLIAAWLIGISVFRPAVKDPKDHSEDPDLYSDTHTGVFDRPSKPSHKAS
jgi:hypothetical protein